MTFAFDHDFATGTTPPSAELQFLLDHEPLNQVFYASILS